MSRPMMSTCGFCGGMHRVGERCPERIYRKAKTVQVQLRNSGRWQRTRREIKERDMHLCQVCMTGRHNTLRLYNSAELEVHHIIPLSVDVDLAYEPDNLVTLCRYHHKMAHDDKIGADELKTIVSIPPALLALNFGRSPTPHSHLNMRGRKKF